jgi:hypothetical protein
VVHELFTPEEKENLSANTEDGKKRRKVKIGKAEDILRLFAEVATNLSDIGRFCSGQQHVEQKKL